MRLYHQTTPDNADLILAHGFRDRADTYLTTEMHSGVWFSDRPLDEYLGPGGSVLFVIDLAEDVVEPYEWIEEGAAWREFLLPASIANSAGMPAIATND